MHLGLHRGVGAAPEARQVARHLHRPMRRRQQLDHQRHLAAGDARDAGRGRTAPAPGSRASAPPPPRSRSAPTSRTARRNGSAPRRRAGASCPRAAAPGARSKARRRRRCDSAVLPSSSGTSHSSALAASAASDRSGHSSPSARRRNITRSRHCCSGLLHGSRSRPSRTMPSASMLRGLVARRDRATAARPAPARRAARCARPRRLAEAASNVISSRLSIVSAKRCFDLVERDRRGQQDAALRRGAGQFGDREERLARQRRRRIDVGAAAVREQERAARAAVLGDAVGIGEREDRAGREIASRRSASTPRIVRPALRHPPRVLAAARAVAAELIEPVARDRRRRRRARARTGSRRCRRRARPRPRAAASTTMRASRGGSGSARSLRALVGDAALARRSRQARRAAPSPRSARRRGGGSRKASVPGSAAPHCARSSSMPDRSAARISGRA